MTRYLWIPVLGTIAALIAILVFHQSRGETEAETAEAPPAPLPGTVPDEEPEAEPEAEPLPEPEREPQEYTLLLRADGRLLWGETIFASVAEALETLAPEDDPRPRVVVGNATDDVTEEQLDEVVKQLRDRCDVRKYYRAPEKTEDE